ncbi:MAG: rhodanese-like domain-containing protein [Candidatus Nitrosoabyssus spongiisocia]|nr:MAG: rhodanese-like domain-containing protein [Nitrosopumilaceae archaeon AB1(1)]
MKNNTTTNIDTLRSSLSDKSVQVIDTRRETDYKMDHIQNAINLPLAEILKNDDPQKIGNILTKLGISNESPITVYDDTFGALASRIAWTLEYLGYDSVSLLDVTYSRWKNMKLEMSSEETKVKPTEPISLNLRKEILATIEQVDTDKENEDTVLIDNRERLNYLEQHIPGAINIPYRMLATLDNILKSPAEMTKLFESRGIKKKSKLITYCGSVGTLSGLAYYALKTIEHPNVKLYVRSFKEWKETKRPTEKQQDANYWDLSAE